MIFAEGPEARESHEKRTVRPGRYRATSCSGTKKRILMRSSGRMLTTAWLAATHSPGRKYTSSTRAEDGAGGESWPTRMSTSRDPPFACSSWALAAATWAWRALAVSRAAFSRAEASRRAAWAASMSVPATAAASSRRTPSNRFRSRRALSASAGARRRRGYLGFGLLGIGLSGGNLGSGFGNLGARLLAFSGKGRGVDRKQLRAGSDALAFFSPDDANRAGYRRGEEQALALDIAGQIAF